MKRLKDNNSIYKSPSKSQKHLILMVKTPKIGQVKTRLGKDIGPLKATQFYRQTAQRLITQLAQDQRWHTFIAIAPKASKNAWPWPKQAIREPQGSGNLGDRMQRLFERHSPHKTLIIGTDIPGINRSHIHQAFEQLAKTGMVVGPSGDGGYWCIGQNNCPRTIKTFTDVRWSTEFSLQDTIKNIPPSSLSLTTIIEDIDTGLDFQTIYQPFQGRWIIK